MLVLAARLLKLTHRR